MSAVSSLLAVRKEPEQVERTFAFSSCEKDRMARQKNPTIGSVGE